jgi:hypothetical protein
MPNTCKVLVIGPTQSGKTLPSLQLPGPRVAFSGEDGLRPYKQLYEFDYEDFSDIDQLNQLTEEMLLKDPEQLARYNTVIYDGLSVAWQAAIEEVEDAEMRISMEDQRKLKAGFKKFNRNVFRLGQLDKNVWATAQSKAQWKIQRGRAPELLGVKGDLDDRAWFAFDLVLLAQVERDSSGRTVHSMQVLKTRYPTLMPLHEILVDFSIERHFGPIFRGEIAPLPVDNTLAVKRFKDEIIEAAKRIGRVSAGGSIPDDVADGIGTLIRSSGDLDALEAALAKLQSFEPVPA